MTNPASDSTSQNRASGKVDTSAQTLEIDRALDLLQEISDPACTKEKRDRIEQELLQIVRQAGAGALGSRGAAYSRMKAAIEVDKERKQSLLCFLSGKSPYARSWAGSFIEQLFDRKDAASVLAQALNNETDPSAASWLAMNLARKARGDPGVCRLIGQAYERAKGDSQAQLQTARAWGYAGCREALAVLREHLLTGGYDQKTVAMDGMAVIGEIDDRDSISAIWETFIGTKWEDVRLKAAELLTLATGRLREEVIEKLLDVLSSSSSPAAHRSAAAEALRRLTLSYQLAEKYIEKITEALKLSDANLTPKIVAILDRSFVGWVKHLVRKIAETPDQSLRLQLARVLAVDKKSRDQAVDLLKAELAEGSPEIKERIAGALQEIGGEEAFKTLQELLHDRYIRPSDELQTVSEEVFKDTIQRMRKNYDTSIRMNGTVFLLGIVVVLVGLVLVIVEPAKEKFFGAAGVIAGLGTLVSLFFFGPLQRIQRAMTELVQIEIAFMSFMHRILQARSIFEQLYLSQQVNLDSLSKFDAILNGDMKETVELLKRPSEPAESGGRGKKRVLRSSRKMLAKNQVASSRAVGSVNQAA